MPDRIDTLTDRWNELRNLAYGRGTQPRVSDATATTVGIAYDKFRAWRKSQLAAFPGGVSSNVFAAMAPDLQGEYKAEETRFNAARTILSAELDAKQLPDALDPSSYLDTIKSGLSVFAWLAVGGLALAAIASFRGRR